MAGRNANYSRFSRFITSVNDASSPSGASQSAVPRSVADEGSSSSWRDELAAAERACAAAAAPAAGSSSSSSAAADGAAADAAAAAAAAERRRATAALSRQDAALVSLPPGTPAPADPNSAPASATSRAPSGEAARPTERR